MNLSIVQDDAGMDDLLSILRSAENVVSKPSQVSSSSANFINDDRTVAGFHPSMIPFPDPIQETGKKASSLPPMSSFPKPLGKMTARQITPDEPLAMSGSLPSFPKPLSKLSSRQITPDGVEFFDQAAAMNNSKPLPASIQSLPVRRSDSLSTLLFDDNEFESFEDVFEPLPLDMAPESTKDISFENCTVKPSPIPQYALSSYGISAAAVQSSTAPATNKARPQRYQQGPWNMRLQELRDFQKEHGHAMVPHLYKKNPQLSQWVKRQRYQYRLKKMGKHSTLSDDREMLLSNMGFVFESHKTSWNESYQQLQAFFLKHGHSRVTKTNADDSLNTWAKHQRRQYKRFVCGQSSHMTLERIQKLEQLQFDWDPRNILGGNGNAQR